MTRDKLISIFKFYRDKLERKGVVKKQLEDYGVRFLDIPVNLQLGHVVYMCDTAIGFVREGRVEKAMRWLGFIQCAVSREYNLDELKNHSRPDVQL